MSTTQVKPIPTPIALPNRHRETISWNENYGQIFKVVQRPESAETIEDYTMIVTPKNKTEWETWSELPEEKLCRLKKNWEIIQKNLSEHKYREIISFIGC